MLCCGRQRNSKCGGSSAREICRHAAPKRPDFHKARNVRIGCPVPFSDQRIPAPFILVLIRTLLEDSTAPLPIGIPWARTSAYRMRCCCFRKKLSTRVMGFRRGCFFARCLSARMTLPMPSLPSGSRGASRTGSTPSAIPPRRRCPAPLSDAARRANYAEFGIVTGMLCATYP